MSEPAFHKKPRAVESPVWRQGCGKYRYADKKGALTAANARKHDHERKRGKVKQLRAYCCPDCGGWHLSHKPNFPK